MTVDTDDPQDVTRRLATEALTGHDQVSSEPTPIEPPVSVDTLAESIAYWAERLSNAPAIGPEDAEDYLHELAEQGEFPIDTDGDGTTVLDAPRLDAHDEDECLLCAPESHPNCEQYTVLQVLDPADVPLGEDDADHLVEIPVCLTHYQAIEQYQNGRNVAEVDVR